MSIHDKKRISRLSSITTSLQTKSLISAPELARRFNVSVRTIYRDIRALEEAGIPIYVEEGKGFRLVEGFRLPPVMFTENEANALIAAEQLILNAKDSSLVREYSRAIEKIKAVVSADTKEKLQLLSQRMVDKYIVELDRTSSYLSDLQHALTNFRLTTIDYTDASGQLSQRTIEPFALLSTRESWVMIAWCRLRQDYRHFRLDRISRLEVLEQVFPAHDLTLDEFLQKYRKPTTPMT